MAAVATGTLTRYRHLRMGGSMAEPKLLDQYRERLRVKHYSLRTEQAYIHWIKDRKCDED